MKKRALKNYKIFLLLRVLLALAAIACCLELISTPTQAAVTSVTPTTWNVIGLDSNSPGSGPNHFPIGAKVCGGTPGTSDTATFSWDTGGTDNGTYIYLSSGTANPVSIKYGSDGCADAYFEVEVAKTASAFDQTRRYHITAGGISTPTPREVYVQHLISQSRNYITDIQLNGTSIPAGGSMSMVVGNTYTVTLIGGTATQGYNQFAEYINFPNTVFQILSVNTSYSSDNSPYVPTPNNKIYADACLWDNDPGSPYYQSCVGGDYKAGGSNVVTTYTIKILSGGGTSQTLNTLLYDFSGASFHYNGDYSTGARIATIVDPATLTFSKSFSPNPGNAGGVSTLTFTLTNPNPGAVSGVNFTDTFPTSPAAMVVASVPNGNSTGCGTPTFSPTAGASSISFSNGTIAANSSCTVQVNVTAPSTGTYTNTSGDLFVGTIDTGKSATDTLTVNAALPPSVPPPSSCSTPVELARWHFDNLANGTTTTTPAYASKAADVTIATAAITGSTSSSITNSTSSSTPNSWSTAGYTNANTATSTTQAYIDFVLDTSHYGGVTIALDVDTNSGTWGGQNHLYIYSSADGGAFSGALQNISPLPTSWTTYPATAASTGTSTTKFRVNAAGAKNASSFLYLDDIVFTGCKYSPPTITKSFSPSPVAVGGTSTLTFTINNPNTAAALTGVSFTDTLPTKALQGTVAVTSGSAIATGTGTAFKSQLATGSVISLSGTSYTVASIQSDTQLTLSAPAGANASGIVSAGLTLSGAVTASQCGGTVTGAAGGRTLSLSGGTIAAGGSCAVTAQILDSIAGPINNVSGFVSSNESGTNSDATGIAAASLTAVLPPAIAETFVPGQVLVGGASTLSFVVTNSNQNNPLSGISFSETLTGMTVASGSSAQCGGTLTTTAPNTVSFAGGTVAAAGSCTLTINVTASSTAGSYVNTSNAVSTIINGVTVTGNTSSAILTVTPPHPAVYLLKQAATSTSGPWLDYVTVTPGTSIYYMFTVDNPGDVDLSSVSVSDPTLSGLGIDLSACSWGTLAKYATATCTVGPIPALSGSYQNTATVTGYYGGTPYTDTDFAMYATYGLSMTKNVTESYFGSAGGLVHYTYVVTNTGSAILDGPITVADNKTTVTCPAVSTVGDHDDFLDPGESVTCTATYTVTAADMTAKVITNTASASSASEGVVAGITTSPVSKTVPLAADLIVTKTDNVGGNTSLGGVFSWTLTVTNAATAGSAASFATGQTLLQDDLPSSGATYSIGTGTLSLAGGTTGTINCAIASNTLTCTAGSAVTMPTGGSFTIPVTVTVTAAGALVNPRASGVCKADPGNLIAEIDKTNNNCTDTVTVLMSAPTVTKSFTPSDITTAASDYSQLTIAVTNPSANTLAIAGAAFTDNYPSGLVNTSSPGATIGGTGCTGTLTAAAGGTSFALSGGTIPANTTCSYSVNVQSSAAGSYTNSTGSITSTNANTGAEAYASLSVSVASTAAAGDKPLYLYGGAASPYPLSRTPTPGNPANIPITAGGSTTWNLNAAGQPLTKNVIITGSVPVTLYMQGNSGANKNFTGTVTLSCLPAAFTSNFTGTLTPNPIALNNAAVGTASATLTSSSYPQTCASGNYLQLTVNNTSGASGTFYIKPVNGATISRIAPPMSTVINVDSVDNYSAAYSSTAKPASGYYTGGNTVYVRSVVSDPFGAFDISSATITIKDPNGTTLVNAAALSEVVAARTSATKTFEYAYSIPTVGPGGAWTATVTAKEGTENTVTNSRTGTFQVVPAPSSLLPAPTVGKSFGSSNITTGGSTSLTMSLQNTSTTTAITGAAFTDSYPSGLTNTGAPTTAITGTGCTGTLAAPASGTSFSLTNGTIPANTTCTYTVNSVTSSIAGTYNNSTGNITSTNANVGDPAVASLSVSAASTGNKNLYLSGGTGTGPFSLSRQLPANNTDVTITQNQTVQWDLSTAGQRLQKPVTITGSVPLSLNVYGDGTFPLKFTAILNCSTAFASPYTVNYNVAGNLPATSTQIFTTLANNGTSQTCPANGYLILTIKNTSGKNNTAYLRPNNAGSYSYASLPASTVINVDTANNYNASYPAVTTPAAGYYTVGQTVYVRAVVSDPFGSFDINSTTNLPQIVIRDPNNNPVKTDVMVLKATDTPLAPTKTFEYSYTIPASGPAGAWSAAVTAYEGSEATVTNSRTGNFQVALPAPTASKSFTPSSMPGNAVSVLTVILTNPNASAITGAVFTDTYPSGLVNTATPNATISGVGCTGTATAAANGTALALSGMTIPANRSCMVTVNVTAAAGGSYVNNTGPITASNAATGTAASATLSVLGPPTAAKSFTPPSVGLGDTSTLTITLTNPSGNTAAITGVGFTDDYQNTTNMQNAPTPGAAISGTGCTGTLSAPANGTTFSLSNGVIPVNTTCTYSVTVTRATTGSYTNSTGTVSTGNAGNGTAATATLTVLNHPTATKSFGTPDIGTSGSSTLVIKVTNPNTGASITGVGFTDNYPSGLQNTSSPTTSVTGTGCTVTTLTAASLGTSFSLSGGVVPASTTCTYTVNGVTSPTAGSYTNPAVSITTTNAGGATTGSATLTVFTPLTVTKVFSPDNISVNNTSLLTVTLTNPNGTDVTGAAPAFTDTYPAGIQNTATPNASTTCSGGTVTANTNGNSLSLSGGTIPANGSCTVTVNVTSTAAGAYTNTINSVATTNAGSSGSASGTLSVATPASGNKPLYLYGGAASPYLLSRTPTPGNPASVPVAAGGNAGWDLGAAGGKVLQKDVTITANVPLTLYMQGNSASSQTFTGNAVLSCSTPFSSNFSSALSISLNNTSVGTANVTLTNGTLPQTCPAGSRLLLTVSNTSGAAGTFYVLPVNGANISQAVPQVSTVINVDTVEFYTAAYPAVTTPPIGYYVVGDPVNIRAVVSDPFGSYDISSASVTIKDSGGTVLVNAAAMTLKADSGAATKIFEYAYTVPAGGTPGSWTATVTAKEGMENTVTHTRTGTFSVTGLPVVVMVKSANVGSVNPGQEIQYTITVQNQGTGPGTSIVIRDDLSPYTALSVNTFGTGAPFQFNGPTSGLTPGTTVYSNDKGVTWTYSPNTCGGTTPCYDANVTNWKIPMSNTFSFTGSFPYPSFTINYKALVR
jgi:uncharacterized repeat protein (TIGR01451 family)